MDIIDKIDEAVNKPSFEEFFLNKKNKRMLTKKFEKYYEEAAIERGQEYLDDENYYSQEEIDQEDIDPIEAYENYAHSDGYSAYYNAAEYTIFDFRKKHDYKRNDESDEEKQYELAKFLGYNLSWP